MIAKEAAKGLLEIGSKETLEFLVRLKRAYGNYLLEVSFEAAILSYSPQEVFAGYGECAAGTRKNPACRRILEILTKYLIDEK